MNKPLMFMNNIDLIESLKARVWEKYKTVKANKPIVVAILFIIFFLLFVFYYFLIA